MRSDYWKTGQSPNDDWLVPNDAGIRVEFWLKWLNRLTPHKKDTEDSYSNETLSNLGFAFWMKSDRMSRSLKWWWTFENSCCFWWSFPTTFETHSIWLSEWIRSSWIFENYFISWDLWITMEHDCISPSKFWGWFPWTLSFCEFAEFEDSQRVWDISIDSEWFEE
jgi:hypothetical protein